MPLKFVHDGPIDNKSSFAQVMAWHPIGNKPLPNQWSAIT